MSKVAPVILNTNPHRPVDFKESALAKVIRESGNLNVEVKEDGCQVNIVVIKRQRSASGQIPEGYQVQFLSREGKAFNGLMALAESLSFDHRWDKVMNEHLEAGLFAENGGFLLQAEVLTTDGHGKYKPCAEIAGDLRRMEPILLDHLHFVAFDLIPLDAVLAGGDYEVFQEVRRGHMLHQVKAITNRFPELAITPVESHEAYTMTHLTGIYEAQRAIGKEGVVAKDPMGYWKRGKKTGQWKVKPDDGCDGTVVGLMWGTPGLSNEGKVIGFRVLTEHGVEVDCGGLTEALKEEYTKAIEDAAPGCQCCDTEYYAGGGCYSGWTCEITYMERLPSGSYRHPNFARFRGITDPTTKE